MTFSTLDWPSLIVGGLMGFVLNLVASYVHDKIKQMNTARKTAMEGLWAEHVPESTSHQYTLGRIYFDKRRKIHAFDGTNFKNNGQPFCHFETVTSYLDRETREYFYTFVAHVEGELDKRYYGFGVVNLTLNEQNALVPARGHYVSANVDQKQMSHTMVRADSLGSFSKVSGTKVIAFLKKSAKASVTA